MRYSQLAILFLAVLLSGCASGSTSREESVSTESVASALNTEDSAPIISIRPVRVLNGRVVVVNADAGLCVVNFPIGQLPPLGEKLTVYRHGIQTGEVKITGPARDDNIAADILSGKIQVGDDVRDR